MRHIRHPSHPAHPTHPVAARSDSPRLPPAILLAADGVRTVAQTLANGQPVSTAFPAGVETLPNYRTTTPATIVSAVREVSIAGGAWSTGLGQTPIAGTTVAIRTRVTDSAGNVRFFPGEAGSATVVQAPAVSVPGAPQDGDARLIWVEGPSGATPPSPPQDGDARLIFIPTPPGAPQDGDARLIPEAA